MSDVTLGTISSEPNGSGEHSLKCPKCSRSFLSVISADNKTGALASVDCPACNYSDEPKHFIAAAHEDEVSKMATDYVQKEINKTLGGGKINLNLKF